MPDPPATGAGSHRELLSYTTSSGRWPHMSIAGWTNGNRIRCTRLGTNTLAGWQPPPLSARCRADYTFTDDNPTVATCGETLHGMCAADGWWMPPSDWYTRRGTVPGESPKTIGKLHDTRPSDDAWGCERKTLGAAHPPQ